MVSTYFQFRNLPTRKHCSFIISHYSLARIRLYFYVFNLIDQIYLVSSVVLDVGRYPRSNIGTRRVVNKGVIPGTEGRWTGMRTQ